jgi:ferrous iron transport protein B
MEFILVGQPNSGKSTIFNRVIGYKSEAANFPGVTVSYTRGNIYVNNEKIEVVDIPGTYSLQTSDEAELVAVDYILNSPQNAVIINILDASVLSRSLELTLQLMELKKPMVIVLNMIDEAERKGIHIDTENLSQLTGLPVLKTIATKGEGISELFKVAQKSAVNKVFAKTIEAPYDVERVIQRLIDLIKKKDFPKKWNHRFLVLKLIEKDLIIQNFLSAYLSKRDWRLIQNQLDSLEHLHKRECDLVISSVRHNLAFKIFEEVARVGLPPKKDLREKIDSLLMHPFLGYIFMAAILYLTFTFIFSIGDLVEPLFSAQIEKTLLAMQNWLSRDSILYYFASGIIQGFGGGIGIVIPYLLPFFIVFSILEDTGYLARIAYLIDNLMHRIGLHGMSVVPMVLGYGCTVPGIMATRVLKSRRDKVITAALTTMVPCSARMIIIFGVAGAISLNAAGLVYVINIIVLGIVGKMMSIAMPEVSPGLLLEIPKYHLPGFKAVMQKTWFRMKEFVVIAWPILIIGSTVLESIHYFRLSGPINSFLAPFTSGVLGLPAFVGIVFLFGILRKELVLVMLITILGTEDILRVMSPTQVYTFTIFSTFYIPCLATFAVLVKELKLKNALLITGLTMMIAIVLSVMIRFLFPLFV